MPNTEAPAISGVMLMPKSCSAIMTATRMIRAAAVRRISGIVVLSRDAGAAFASPSAIACAASLVFVLHVGLGQVLDEFPGDVGHEQRHAGGARGRGELLPLAAVHQAQHLHDPALGNHHRHADQDGDADAARHDVGQLGRVAGGRLAFELRIEAAHHGLHQRLEDQDADHQVQRHDHRRADEHLARNGTVDQRHAQRREEQRRDWDPLAADAADQRRQPAETAEPLLRGHARTERQPQEDREIDQAADHLEGGHRVERRVDGHQHLAQDAHQDDDQHDRGDPQVEGLRLVIARRAQARRRQLRLEHDAEQQHVEAPREDSGQYRRGQPVLPGRAGEPEARGGIADQPDGEHAQPIERSQAHKVEKRSRALLGNGVHGKPCAQAVQHQAQDRLGRDRGDNHGAQEQQESRGAATSVTPLIEQGREPPEVVPSSGSACTTRFVPSMKATKGSGPDFGSTWTILGGGGAFDLDFESEAAGVGAGFGAAAGAPTPSAFSFSVTELLIESTSESNCCCERPAGGDAGAWAWAEKFRPRAENKVSEIARASVRSAFTISIPP